MKQNRRVKVVWVGEDTVLGVLAGYWRVEGLLTLPMLGGLPDDCDVLSVQHSWERRQFGFLVAHPSFPEVADGDHPAGEEGFLCTVRLERTGGADTPLTWDAH